MTPFEFGDVVLIPFPFTNQIQSKKRPAVIINSRAYNQSHSDVIAMALTSNLSGSAQMLQNWQAAGLPKTTAFKPAIFSLEVNLIVRKLGRLSVEDETALRTILQGMLG